MQRLDSRKWNSIIPNEKCPIFIFYVSSDNFLRGASSTHLTRGKQGY